MVCGGGRGGGTPKNGIVVAVDVQQGKLRSTRRVAARVLGAEVMCAADGHTRRLAAIHGLNEETKKEHLGSDGVPVATCFALQMQEPALHAAPRRVRTESRDPPRFAFENL